MNASLEFTKPPEARNAQGNDYHIAGVTLYDEVDRARAEGKGDNAPKDLRPDTAAGAINDIEIDYSNVSPLEHTIRANTYRKHTPDGISAIREAIDNLSPEDRNRYVRGSVLSTLGMPARGQSENDAMFFYNDINAALEGVSDPRERAQLKVRLLFGKDSPGERIVAARSTEDRMRIIENTPGNQWRDTVRGTGEIFAATMMPLLRGSTPQEREFIRELLQNRIDANPSHGHRR